jgi:lysozyme
MRASMCRSIKTSFDALDSLVFNIGIGGFRGSSVLRQLNLKNYQAAADDFLMWDEPPSLIGRRRDERTQFLSEGAWKVAV